MDLKLNIYEKNKIVKTHITNSYGIEYGIIEDVLNAIDIDKLGDKTSTAEMGKIIIKIMPQIRPLFLSIFEDLTEEELRHARLSEMILIIKSVCNMGLAELTAMGSNNEKN